MIRYSKAKQFYSLSRFRFFALTLLSTAIFLSSDIFSKDAELVIRHVRGESETDSRNEYPLAVLSLVLEKSGAKFKLSPVKTIMTQGRAISMVEDGENLDVVWTMTSPERESAMFPIRYPIDKGLIGMRLMLIRSGDEEKFRRIKTIDQLKGVSAGQGHDWPDLKILESNGLKVFGSASYKGLFEMLVANRFDYFPRSAEEIWAEAEKRKDSGIIVEKTLIIRYPTASYFFVSKNNKKLAGLLVRGFEKAIADGSFSKIFDKYNQKVMASLKGRTVIELKNPLLPKETPIERKELWIQL